METIEPEAAKAEVNRILMKHLSASKASTFDLSSC